MKNVIMKYVENLLAWGDSLFRNFTRESVNEALQVYVIANHILGPRPEVVPAGYLGLIPETEVNAEPIGTGASVSTGGKALSWFASSVAKMFSTQSSIDSINAGQSAKMAGYIRREQD